MPNAFVVTSMVNSLRTESIVSTRVIIQQVVKELNQEAYKSPLEKRGSIMSKSVEPGKRGQRA